jgi:hypothetical protein
MQATMLIGTLVLRTLSLSTVAMRMLHTSILEKPFRLFTVVTAREIAPLLSRG